MEWINIQSGMWDSENLNTAFRQARKEHTIAVESTYGKGWLDFFTWIDVRMSYCGC